MPPKATSTAANGENDRNTFLVNCIKCARAKLDVDYKDVAEITGLSEGGVANKFRALMKQFEDDGATWTKANTGKKAATDKPTPKRTVAKKPKPKAEATVKDEHSSDEEKPPAKKAKSAVAKNKGTASSKNNKKVTTTADASKATELAEAIEDADSSKEETKDARETAKGDDEEL